MKQNRAYGAVLLLIILLTSFMYFFVQFSVDRNVTNMEYYLRNQKQEDVRFQFTGTADKNKVLKGLENQLITEERSIKKVKSENKTYFLLSEPQRLNMPYTVKGRLRSKQMNTRVRNFCNRITCRLAIHGESEK